MILEKIDIQNFGLVSNLTIHFPKNGLFTVAGQNLDALAASSMGSAKSTIFSEAVVWGLFGKRLRDPNNTEEVVKEGSVGGCLVREYLRTDSDKEIITERYRKHPVHGDSFLIYVNKHEITGSSKRHSQEILNDLIGEDFSTFVNSKVFSIAFEDRKFAKLSDGDKKKVIYKILGLDRYERGYKKCSERYKLATNSYTIISSELSSQNEQLESINTSLKSIDSKSNIWKAKQDQIIDELSRQKSVLEEKIESIEDSIIPTESSYNLALQLGECKSKLELLNYEIHSISNELDSLRDLKGKDCPTCHQMVKDIEGYAVILLGRLSSLEEEKKGLSLDFENLNTTSIQSSNYEKIKADLILLKKDLFNLTKELNEKYSEASPFISLRKDLENQINILIKRKEEKQRELDKVSIDIEHLSFWIEAYGPSGIRNYLFESYLPHSANRLDYYSQYLTLGQIKVRFNNQKQLKSGEFRDKIALDVTNTLGQNSYVSSSDGEQSRIDYCIVFTLGDLSGMRAREKWNFLILDEIFSGALDPVGCELLGNLLQEMSKDRAIYVITHNTDLQLNCPIIDVIRKNNQVEVNVRT